MTALLLKKGQKGLNEGRLENSLEVLCLEVQTNTQMIANDNNHGPPI